VLQHQANFTPFRDLCQHREAGFSGRNRIHLLSLGWMKAYLNSLSVSSMERRGEWIHAYGASTAQNVKHDVITSRGIDSSPRE